MSYRFAAGRRLVVPHLDKFKQRVKASWVGSEMIKVKTTCCQIGMIIKFEPTLLHTHVHHYTLACSFFVPRNVRCLYAQVLQERLPFLTAHDLLEAFQGQRVLVNGCIATPTQQLKLTEMVEIIFHRHEPEVRDYLATCDVETCICFAYYTIKSGV